MQPNRDKVFKRIFDVLDQYPDREIEVEGVGLSLISKERFENQQTGYRFTPDGQSLIGDGKGAWKAEWWVIGNDCLVYDPVMVDINTENLVVYTAVHGKGAWQAEMISTSLEGLLESIDVLYQFKQEYVNFQSNNQIPIRKILVSSQNQVTQHCEVQTGYWKNYFESLLDVIDNYDDGIID